MKPYWVDTGNPLRLAIVPRPRGGDWLEDELDQMKRAGVVYASPPRLLVIVAPIPHPRSSTSPVFESTFFLRIVLQGKAQMGEVWDHPNRKKVWPGSGGVYSGEGLHRDLLPIDGLREVILRSCTWKVGFSVTSHFCSHSGGRPTGSRAIRSSSETKLRSGLSGSTRTTIR